MSVNLSKGQKVSLTKDNPGLDELFAGLGWDINRCSGSDFDLDATAMLLRGGKMKHKKRDIVYFGNLTHESGAVVHTGDNLTGAGEGDDEVINISLSRIPADVDKIVIAVNIYQAHRRKQDFGMVDNAFIRLCDRKTGKELYRYDLSGSSAGMTAMIFAEVYRHGSEWKFGIIGQGTDDGTITDMAKRYA